jgi:hypothetical protein
MMITQVGAALWHTPYFAGYGPSNWCNITDLAIKKELCNLWAAEMRMLQLMTAKFNTNNKPLGRDMMWNGELCQVIPEEHSGSRKGK